MALEERLVGADVLVSEHALARLEFGDAIAQQERVAVRQHTPDFGDVDRHGHGCGHQSSLSRGVFSRALTRRASVSSCLKRAAFLRSEEHKSELQSLMRNSYAVFCLKKKKIKN